MFFYFLNYFNGFLKGKSIEFVLHGISWLDGLVVWFSLRVREVLGSIPSQALDIFLWNKKMIIFFQNKMEMSGVEPEAF